MTTRETKRVWKVAAASVRGLSHERSGQPCQDAHRFVVTPEGVPIGAVADGAGSAPLSAAGAAAAAQAVVQSLRVSLFEGLPETEENWRARMTWAMQAARDAVEAEAEAREVAVRDLATTLIVVVATADQVVVAQVGDGAVVIGDQGGHIRALTTPQGGEFVNETTFLTVPEGLEMVETCIWQGAVRSLALFSDGLQRLALKLPECEAHTPFFAPLFRFVGEAESEEAQTQLAAFLRSPRIVERTDDDLTLLLASLPA